MAKLKKSRKAEDLDLLPIMNLFSILIPFLLSVAVFQKMAIVEVHLPERADVPPDMSAPPEPDPQALALTVAITGEGLTIWARGGSLPTVFTKEMWTYRCKSDQEDFTIDPVEYKNKPIICKDGKSEALQNEKEIIHLYALQRTSEEDPGTPLKAVVNANDSAYIDGNGQFYTAKAQIKPGMVVRTLAEGSAKKLTPGDVNEAKEVLRSAYDELAMTLNDIHNRFIDAPDGDDIIVLANDDIVFDKVIQVMDRAREAGFWKIQLAKLEGG